MFGLVTRGVQNCEGDAEQPSNKSTGGFVAPPTLKPEVISQCAPCRLRQVGVAVRQQVIATGFPHRKDNRAALVNMKIGEGGFRRSAASPNPFAVAKASENSLLSRFAAYSGRDRFKGLCFSLVIDEVLIERERKKAEHLRLVETDLVQILPNNFRVVSCNREFAIRFGAAQARESGRPRPRMSERRYMLSCVQRPRFRPCRSRTHRARDCGSLPGRPQEITHPSRATPRNRPRPYLDRAATDYPAMALRARTPERCRLWRATRRQAGKQALAPPAAGPRNHGKEPLSRRPLFARPCASPR